MLIRTYSCLLNKGSNFTKQRFKISENKKKKDYMDDETVLQNWNSNAINFNANY